ncbi:transglycosylase domain-containing protein [Actinocorallia longicatena]|uniref:Penicillin-insensitive transglycosylase n=1 Tax=Actinocorallia longicatena TaxID=111803 RepID=A0ABP6QPA0_9ACTN
MSENKEAEAKPVGGKKNRILRRAAYTVLGLLGVGVIGFAIAYVLTPVPDGAQLDARKQLNTYYYADEKTVIAEVGTNRTAVPISKVSKAMQQAVISAENRSFYSDPGVSFSGTARAFWSTVSGGQVQGGSTITQQMVRNYYRGLSQERSVTRKLKEVMVSLKVGQSKDKDWIMEQYLNTIFFGRDSYGVQAAAQAYFTKDAKDLTPAESAYLAAAIQQPTVYSNVTKANRAAAEQRWRYVLDGMVAAGNVTADDVAKMKFPKLAKQNLTNIYAGQNGYMIVAANNELRRRGYSDEQIALGGMKVVTTYQKDKMDAAQAAVKRVTGGMAKEQEVGLVSVDTSNGEVVGFYGGRNYLDKQLSNSFSSYRQAGSGFKPYVLAAALDQGMKLTDTVSGNQPFRCNPGEAGINNDGNEGSLGEINLVRATAKSSNTAFARLNQDIGADKVTAMAEKFGIPDDQLTAKTDKVGTRLNQTCSFAIGTASLSPVQQAAGYATFANGGTYYKPHVVKAVTPAGGKTKKIVEKGVRAVSTEVAGDATYAMSKVVESGTGAGAQLDDREAAGKTGTTDDGASVWFNGYVPQISTSVMIFHGSTKKQFKPLVIPGYSAYGGAAPAAIWRDYMTEATRNLEVKDFPEPSTYASNGYDRDDDEQDTRPTQEPSDRPSEEPSDDPSTEPTEPTKPTDPPSTDPKPSQSADPDPEPDPGDGAEPDPGVDEEQNKPARGQQTPLRATPARHGLLGG